MKKSRRKKPATLLATDLQGAKARNPKASAQRRKQLATHYAARYRAR